MLTVYNGQTPRHLEEMVQVELIRTNSFVDMSQLAAENHLDIKLSQQQYRH